MIEFPTLCVDDFYKNPDEVRELALSQEYMPDLDGRWPGKRTTTLHTINEDLFHGFCRKLFDILFDTDKDPLTWTVFSTFHLVDNLSNDPLSPLNLGWPHKDECIIGGLIYLTPGMDEGSGTSIYQMLEEPDVSLSYKRSDYYKGNADESFGDTITEYRSHFKETIRFSNVYNRMICFDANTVHGPTSFYSSNGPRLTQVFFVQDLKSESKPPLVRSQERNIL